MSAREALDEMVESSASSVRALLVREDESAGQYTRNQLWKTIEVLARAGDSEKSVPYGVFLDYVVRGDEKVMRALIGSQLISSCDTSLSRTVSVKAGSPLFGAVYKRLYEDASLRAIYGLSVLGEEIARENKVLQGFEEELEKLYTAQKAAKQANNIVNIDSTSSWSGNNSARAALEAKQIEREQLETDIFESRKIFLLTRIGKQQAKLDTLHVLKDQYGGQKRAKTRKVVPHAV